LSERKGSTRALWTVLVTGPSYPKPEKLTSSLTKIKDFHPCFEKIDYILHFRKTMKNREKSERNSRRKRWIC
jgi:hypothetical protein